MTNQADEQSNGVGHLHVPPPAEPVSVWGKMRDLLMSGLGIGSSPAAPAEPDRKKTANEMAEERTHAALDRTNWAAERTLMAWIRTALSMISFGFTIGKIGQALSEVEVKSFRGIHTVGVGTIAGFLVVLGTGSLLAASVQYAFRVHQLHQQGLPRQLSLAFAVSLVLTLLGFFALSSLVMNL